MESRIVAVCTSLEKGEAKSAVERVELKTGHGIEGDAHAGNTHRQISLLAEERIDEMRARGLDLVHGAFGENLVTRGFDLGAIRVGDRLRIGEAVELEVTQLGKECHDPCAIYQQVGYCIMPEKGVFTRVLNGGPVQPGDPLDRS